MAELQVLAIFQDVNVSLIALPESHKENIKSDLPINPMKSTQPSCNLATLLAVSGIACAPLTAQSAAPAKPNSQMQAVLDKLGTLGGKPIESLSPEDARKQPTPADAVMTILKEQNKDAPEKVGKTDDVTIELGNGDIKGRIYKPEGDGPFPMILYIHGGGWVIADLDTYDSSARALTNGAGSIVVSIHYRQAPEHKFPAAHEDAYGAYQWVLKNGHRWGGNTKNVAVVGESAGGNLAAAVCIMAQAEGIQAPVHQVLVYPIADTRMDTPSYVENANAKPLSAAMMKWFLDHALAKPEDASDSKVALLQAKTLKGLPAATIVTAQIDPLRSEGEALAKKLTADGVEVAYKNYDGVTHEFFGMGAVVDEAKEANAFVCSNLKAAFAKLKAPVAKE